MTDQEIIDFAYAEFEPFLNISDELNIRTVSDDGGRHLEFNVQNRDAGSFLRAEVPHTYKGYRTIIIYRIGKTEE
jgi:hypothetical protein